MDEPIKPKYEFAKEDGAEFIAPVKRKINKTMEITESFTYFDCLQYCMRMEKSVKDKQAEIDGLNAMIKAYKDEIELIEQTLSVTEIEEAFQLALHEKLKEEATDTKIDEAGAGLIKSPYVGKKEE